MRVLIIDDHATNRELCRIMLSHITPHVDLFADGQEVVGGRGNEKDGSFTRHYSSRCDHASKRWLYYRKRDPYGFS